MNFHATASKVYQSLSGDNPNRALRKDIAHILSDRLAIESHKAVHGPSDDLKQQLIEVIEQGRYMFWASAIDQRVLTHERCPTAAWAYAALNSAYFEEQTKRAKREEADGQLPVDVLKDHHRTQRHTLYAMAAIAHDLERWGATRSMVELRSVNNPFVLGDDVALPREVTPQEYELAQAIQHVGDVCRVLKDDVPHAPDTETLRHSFDPGRLLLTVHQPSESVNQAYLNAEYEGRPLSGGPSDARITWLSMSPEEGEKQHDVAYLPDLLTHVGLIREQHVSALAQRDDALDILQQIAKEALALIAARDHALNRPVTAADILRETAIALLTRIDAQYEAIQLPWTRCTVQGRHGVIGAVAHECRGENAFAQAVARKEEWEDHGYIDLRITCDVERQPLECVSDLFLKTTPDGYLSGYTPKIDAPRSEEIDLLAPSSAETKKNLLDWSDI